VRPIEYWLARFLWDFGSRVVFTVGGIMITFTAFDNELASWSVFLLSVAFMFAVFPQVYLVTFIFDNPKSANGGASSFAMIGFLLAYIATFVSQLATINIDPGLSDAIRVIGMAISPAASYAVGLQASVLGDAYNKPTFVWSSTIPVLGSTKQMQVGIGQPLFCMCMQGVVFTIATCGIELVRMKMGRLGQVRDLIYNFFNAALRLVCIGMFKTGVASVGAPADVEDQDVQQERTVLERESSLDDPHNDPYAVRLCNLQKRFRARGGESQGTLAVADMCVRMKRGECFALLGANGAGKSTTFDMLLRKTLPTGGESYVNGVSTSAASTANSVFLELGYCPQQNALFDELTGREVMDFYCAIRGVSDAERDGVVSSSLRAADLEPYADRPCGRYSGGNKRKLSLAIALVGDPTFAVLDEPSAGVDPAARRRLWRTINRSLARGATIALTTHHMSEAAHLGSRIGIMVKGRLGCLGSPQHLKLRYGRGYEVSVHMHPGRNVRTEVLPLLQRLSRVAEVVENPSAEFAKVSLGKAGEDFSLVGLFEALENAKQSLGVNTFAANQADLEQVFAHFARIDRKLESQSKSSLKKPKGVDAEWTFIMEADGANIRFRQEFPDSLPEQLSERGLNNEDWDRVTALMNDGLSGHPFFKNPDLEGVYFCFPLSIVQFLLCALNPLTWRMYGRFAESKRSAVAEINALLARHGVVATWPSKSNGKDSLNFWLKEETLLHAVNPGVELNPSSDFQERTTATGFGNIK